MTVDRRVHRGAPAALAAAVLTGCGLPIMAQPATLQNAGVPTGSATSLAADRLGTALGTAPSLFFVSGDNQLRAVRRAPVSGDGPSVIEQTLQQLVAGPDVTERGAGLASAIPPGLTLHLVRLTAGLAVVDLEGTDPGPAADQAHLATGQVVLTLTALPDVYSVLLTRNGLPLEATLPDGELTALPLVRPDFTVLVQK